MCLRDYWAPVFENKLTYILRFFRISKNVTFYVCFERTCQKVASKSLVLNPSKAVHILHSVISDHCNSVPSSPRVIHSEHNVHLHGLVSVGLFRLLGVGANYKSVITLTLLNV